jgi:lipoprotein-releasing system permease protein
MYKLQLIFKYLRKRRIAWVSLIAVTLCVTMVLVVISVMGGWLRMFRQSFHGLSGDILIEGGSLYGFGYYEQVMQKVQGVPGVESVAPVIQTFGLINIANRKPLGVQVFGYPIEQVGQVNNFPQSLYRQYQQYIDAADDPKSDLTDSQRQTLRDQAAQGAAHPSFALPLGPEDYKAALPRAKSDITHWPGMIAGYGVVNIHKDTDNHWENRDAGLFTLPVRLTVLGLTPGEFDVSMNNKSDTNYWIVDFSHTGVWQYDDNSVYVPFDKLQHDLNMDAQSWTRSDGTKVTEPARCSDIYVKVKDGYDLNATCTQVDAAVHQVWSDIESQQMANGGFVMSTEPPDVETWEQSQAVFLSAIEHEKLLMTFLFGIISIVAIFLIFCIFYMIVIEKTRDIGIIKSVGATNGGIAAIFLGYGLVIGVLGSGLGLAAAYGIIHNINYLHEELGRLLHVVIFNPQVYQFDRIPNTMSATDIIVIVSIAILSSVLGALVPAIRAASMNPVDAVRWE